MAVYFVQRGEAGPIKIGQSTTPLRRFQALQTASEESLRLLGIAPDLVERDLHARFAAHRVRGEWFAPVQEILALANEYAVAALSVRRAPRCRLEAIRRDIFRMNQKQFAEIAGVDAATISRWETGEFIISLSAFVAIRNAVIARGVPWREEWMEELASHRPLERVAA